MAAGRRDFDANQEEVKDPPIVAAYSYQPLEGPDSIGMLKLLPGTTKEPIQISVHHRSLSNMRHCSSVSYEWGSSSREHSIFCDGKALKVTENLSTLLRQLISSRGEGYYGLTRSVLT
jgi:hypothetical protein